MIDFSIQNEGSIVLFTPESQGATDWINENIADDAQYHGRALVVEHRYADGIIEGILSSGLSINGIRS